MHIVLTIIGTILVGAFTFAVGQMIVRGAIEPALKLKRLLATIGFDLDFFADRFDPHTPTQREWRDRFRNHGYALREHVRQILGYRVFRFLLRLPPRENLNKAAEALVVHSNKSAEPGQPPYDCQHEIKRLIATDPVGTGDTKRRSGWLRLGIVTSVAWVLISVFLYFAGIWFYPSRLLSSTGLYRLYAWVAHTNQYDALLKATGEFWDRDPMLYPAVNEMKLTLLVLSPLICGWLLLFALPRSIRWVRKGFYQ